MFFLCVFLQPFSFIFHLLLRKLSVLDHEVFRSNPLEELNLSRFGEHGLRDGKIFLVIFLGNLILGRANNAVSLQQHGIRR